MKTLLIGADGLLGSYWMKASREIYPDNPIVGTSKRLSLSGNTLFLELSSASLEKIDSFISNVNPDVVVYLAGVTNVEECEREKEKALDLNANFPATIAKACSSLAIGFVYISTDHLFGDEGKYFSEESNTVLLNYYAYTKKIAEEKVLKNHPRALIIRTNFYGKSLAKKPSFTDWIESNLLNQVELKVADDIYFNPIFMRDLVVISHLLIEKKQAGIFNVTSDERISKYQFVLKYAKTFNLNYNLVKPYSEKLEPRQIRRPFEMSLSNKKMKMITGFEVGDISSGLEKLKNEIERSTL